MKIRPFLLTGLMLLSSAAHAAPSRFTVSGKISGGAGYSVNLLAATGEVRTATANARGAFSFRRVPASFAKGATLQLVGTDGSYYGPVVLKKARNKAYLHLSGKLAEESSSIALGTITLKGGYALLRTAPVAPVVNTRKVTVANAAGAPIGSGRSGLVSTAAVRQAGTVGTLASLNPGDDLDRDGVPNAFDVDDDGDTILDAFDETSASTTAANQPFTGLFLTFADTLNYNINPSLSRAAIDAVVGGTDKFSLTFFFSEFEGTNVNGGHVICPSPLTYCAPTTGTSIYGGIVESDPALRGLPWVSINTNGSGYPNLEQTSVGGRNVLVASVQPRVGTSQFRPGDVYRVAFTANGGAFSERTLSLPPYFVTVPAVKTHESGAGEVTVDYSDPFAPGMSNGNPIDVSGSSLLRVTFYRPQRLAISGAESGEYRDMGHLHYGALVSGDSITSEFTCAGLYSGLSSTLSEDAGALGTGNSPFAQDGARLWPLTDSASDAEPNTASTMSFSVDLRTCLTRAGIPNDPSAVYRVTLTAAGEDLAGGANRAAQVLHVRFP